MLEQKLAYSDDSMVMPFLHDNEGIFNVFNYMGLRDLIEMLQSPILSKDVKLLAIQRWLSSSG